MKWVLKKEKKNNNFNMESSLFCQSRNKTKSEKFRLNCGVRFHWLRDLCPKLSVHSESNDHLNFPFRSPFSLNLISANTVGVADWQKGKLLNFFWKIYEKKWIASHLFLVRFLDRKKMRKIVENEIEREKERENEKEHQRTVLVKLS